MTLVNPKIDPREVFSVRQTLDFHGFEVESVEDKRDTLLPTLKWVNPDAELLFSIFNDYESRKQLYYKVLDPDFNVSAPLVKDLITEINFLPESKRYFTTFDWYIGELMIKNFGAFSSAHGVSIKNILGVENISYYELLVVLRNTNLMYFKTSLNAFSKEEVINNILHGMALYCESTVMITDESIKDAKIISTLRNIPHPVDEKAQINKIWLSKWPEVVVYEWGNFYIISNEGDLKEKLRIIMRINSSKKVNVLSLFNYDTDHYKRIGFESQNII